MIRWAAAHPVVREVHGSAPFVVGQTASQLLINTFGAGPYADLIQLGFDGIPEFSAPADCAPDALSRLAASVQLPHQLVLGLAVAAEARRMGVVNEVKEEDGATTLRHAATQAAHTMVADAEQRVRALKALADQLGEDRNTVAR
jgi:hypothetical protein